MAEIKIGDLLKLQENLTTTVRYEVGEARSEFREGLVELRELHDQQRTRVDQQGRDIARLDERSRLTSRGILASLTAKQKAALWSLGIAAGGAVLDGLRHLVGIVAAMWARGVHP